MFRETATFHDRRWGPPPVVQVPATCSILRTSFPATLTFSSLPGTWDQDLAIETQHSACDVALEFGT